MTNIIWLCIMRHVDRADMSLDSFSQSAQLYEIFYLWHKKSGVNMALKIPYITSDFLASIISHHHFYDHLMSEIKFLDPGLFLFVEIEAYHISFIQMIILKIF